MDRKGEVGTIGAFILVFVGVIVAISLLTGGITSNVGTLTNMNNESQTVTLPVAGSLVTLRGQAAHSISVFNATGGETVPATNYSVINYVVSNGQLVSQLNSTGGVYAGKTVNLSYISEPFGYDTSTGGRTLAGLIIIFAALAIAVFVIAYVLKNGLDFM